MAVQSHRQIRTSATTGSRQVSGPVAIKGGRGLLTPHDVERLAQSATPPESGAAVTEQFLATFQENADEMFAPDAALRLRRSAELLRLGLSTEVIHAIAGASGELSEVELRVLIPYLLADETARANTRLWRNGRDRPCRAEPRNLDGQTSTTGDQQRTGTISRR